MPTLRWPKNGRITFQGRNGTGFCTGIELLLHRDYKTGQVDRVMLSPFTSRDSIANCNFDVPVEALPELIRELQRIAAEHA